MYVSKVLPELKKKYPGEYKEIFDGNNITKPAGYYPKGSEKRADVNADTIWNFVSKIEGPEKEEKEGKSSGGGTISK